MKLTSIEIVDGFDDEYDALMVGFDDGTSAYMFYKYADAMTFLNKDVIVSFRKDLYKGSVVDVVNTFTEVSVVHTLDSDDNIKLYSNAVDNHSNVTFEDMEDGCHMLNAVMYCLDQRYEGSSRATWLELTVRDSKFKVRSLRLFDYDRTVSFKGKYIKCDIRKNKYGLNTDVIMTDDTVPAELPDVAICRDYCMKYFSGRSDMIDMLDKIDFWNQASTHIATVAGGELIKLAYELRLLNTYRDILPDVDFDSLDLALLLMHATVKVEEDDMSPALRAIITASNFVINNRLDAMKIIDGLDNDTRVTEKALFKDIRKQAEKLLERRYA